MFKHTCLTFVAGVTRHARAVVRVHFISTRSSIHTRITVTVIDVCNKILTQSTLCENTIEQLVRVRARVRACARVRVSLRVCLCVCDYVCACASSSRAMSGYVDDHGTPHSCIVLVSSLMSTRIYIYSHTQK